MIFMLCSLMVQAGACAQATVVLFYYLLGRFCGRAHRTAQGRKRLTARVPQLLKTSVLRCFLAAAVGAEMHLAAPQYVG